MKTGLENMNGSGSSSGRASEIKCIEEERFVKRIVLLIF
jgi:hypothetical protein